MERIFAVVPLIIPWNLASQLTTGEFTMAASGHRRLGLAFAAPLGGNVSIRSMPVRPAAAGYPFCENRTTRLTSFSSGTPKVSRLPLDNPEPVRGSVPVRSWSRVFSFHGRKKSNPGMARLLAIRCGIGWVQDHSKGGGGQVSPTWGTGGGQKGLCRGPSGISERVVSAATRLQAVLAGSPGSGMATQ